MAFNSGQYQTPESNQLFSVDTDPPPNPNKALVGGRPRDDADRTHQRYLLFSRAAREQSRGAQQSPDSEFIDTYEDLERQAYTIVSRIEKSGNIKPPRGGGNEPPGSGGGGQPSKPRDPDVILTKAYLDVLFVFILVIAAVLVLAITGVVLYSFFDLRGQLYFGIDAAQYKALEEMSNNTLRPVVDTLSHFLQLSFALLVGFFLQVFRERKNSSSN